MEKGVGPEPVAFATELLLERAIVWAGCDPGFPRFFLTQDAESF